MCDFHGALEPIFRAICYPIGWPIVRLLTLGKYPVKGSWFSTAPAAQWTSGIGLAVLLVVMMALLKQFDVI
ncbi:hypothetical protein KDX38_13755 [Pseudomonas sp. CDFA 602]|uniref:hypothetical protein n=1 Tax=Pseudomonas californiensis TaxID=2829823 RepID=UPI001E5E728F|nr:hypothetical protein [Pseudomonas californiensis]MCD5994738.1 hypothetical protein [Pseudomonas californiensis]MCD6000277.1 hypothetical protein [Pseudomonas californiensis]